MDGVFEIIFVGRGGQGAKTAAEMIARFALKQGKFVQSFPDYGPERKGAPVRAFTRISDSEIRGCSSEANPDVLVIIDPTLLTLNGSLFTFKKGQKIIVNSTDHSDNVFNEFNIHTIDATKIAMDVTNSTITNTTMLGAFAKVTGFLGIDDLNNEITEEFSKKLSQDMLKKNFVMTQRAFDEVR